MAKGYLIVRVFVDNIAQPVNNARVEVINQNIIVNTNIEGVTPQIELNAPNKEYSEVPQYEVKPFSTYNVTVSKTGLVPKTIENVEIYPEIISYQDVYLTSTDETSANKEVVTIDEPTLWGDYDPLVPSEGAKRNNALRVTPRVYIPEYIIVHDGIPTNSSANNYYVNFQDYIKNVASSEIYATWPQETIKANVLAILSFTLNRIYTEWYLSKGYNFTITSTTAYDQKYTHGRTIFDSISKVVDEIFNQYIKFPGRSEPFFAQYNDGVKINNKGWLNQWGSKDLGDKGYSAIQILKYYYGNTILIDNGILINNYPTSFPGYNLKEGMCGEAILVMQNELNKIHGSYPAIPLIQNPNGIFDSQTTKAVQVFQRTFGLTADGVVGFASWYKIQYYYMAITNMTKGIY